MQTKILIKNNSNIPPEEEVNQAIRELGEGWYVRTAETNMIHYSGPMKGSQLDIVVGHIMYVTTVVMQKD